MHSTAEGRTLTDVPQFPTPGAATPPEKTAPGAPSPKGERMSETEHEAEAEAAETPLSPEHDSDDETLEEEAHEAERGASEPAAAVAPKSEKEIERSLKSLERAGTSYRNAVSRAMGEDANELLPCPRCNAPTLGLIFPPDLAPVDDEVREAVLASIGQGANAGPPLEKAQGVETCPACAGNGVLEFPTFVEHTRVQQCVKCLGSGYVNKNEPQQNVYTMPNAGTTTEGANVTWTPPPPADSWGRPVGHPHYGQNPAQVGT